jgi:hypothetical protein
LSGDLAFLPVNPASLARLSTRQLLFTAESLYEGLSYQGLAWAVPSTEGVVGLIARRVDYGSFAGRDEWGNATTAFTAGSYHVGLGLGWPVTPTLDLGLQIGYRVRDK